MDVSNYCVWPFSHGFIIRWTLRFLVLWFFSSTFLQFHQILSEFLGVVSYWCCVTKLCRYQCFLPVLFQIKRHKWSYFPSFWSILDLLIIAVSICCISFNIFRTIMVNKDIENKVNEGANKFVDLDEVSYWQLVFNYTLAITVFLAWVKVWCPDDMFISLVAVLICSDQHWIIIAA